MCLFSLCMYIATQLQIYYILGSKYAQYTMLSAVFVLVPLDFNLTDVYLHYYHYYRDLLCNSR